MVGLRVRRVFARNAIDIVTYDVDITARGKGAWIPDWNDTERLLGEDYARDCRDAVAGGILDRVHGFVGEVQQIRFDFGIGRVGGDTDAGGDANIQLFVLQPHRIFDLAVQPARHQTGII